MTALLWAKEIHGSVEHVDPDSVVTAPRFGDGNWRGGWWARYQHHTGELIWQRPHRRGARLIGVVGDAIIATTHKSSGVYAIDYRTGRKLWSRLGGYGNLLLKILDYLPCDNEADSPALIYKDHILTARGRLLDPNNGRIVSHHAVEFCRGIVRAIDGNPIADWHPEGRFRYGGIPVHPETADDINELLAQEGLEISGPEGCLVQRHDHAFVIACAPPSQYRAVPQSRLFVPAIALDVPHFLIVVRRSDNKVVHREELGLYYHAEIAWADDTTLAITLQKKQQWSWSYRRDLRVYDVKTGISDSVAR